MKKIAIFCALLMSVVYNADAAMARNPRGMAATNTTTNTATRSTTARSAATARSATPTRASTATATTARAATTGRTTVSRTPAASSSSSAVARSAVTARAGATQKVINTGTKIAAANENTAIESSCQQKYFGCMDSFCMLDNTNGGRCICSDRNAEFDDILAEIQELDSQSYEMATVGVDSIENDYDVTAVYETVDSKKSSIDLGLWDSGQNNDDADEFSLAAVSLIDKSGDELYAASDKICAATIPECADQMNFLRLMYTQQINNDCVAYENSLKQQRNASFQKLETAKSALRQASYTQVVDANKYDLGQCVVEFKNCMIDTGGCGDDFSGCASVAAFDSTNTRGRGATATTYEIKGSATSISIQASTYDILLSKKPLCESVTKQCQNVASQVWDTFLREVAPEIKNAELIAEDNARQDCIGNISSCFQQACRDTIDPNDPDGSYDMCLTRPETMLNLCQVPLNACGISTASASDAETSPIWDFVVARLASMRVNSCTTAFKECLQSEDRCGPDYTQCVGLDTDTIMRICPYDSLVGCQQVYSENDIRGNAVYEELYKVAQGIFLNIDNEMLDYCQAALDQAVISACGDTENCNKFVNDSQVGSRSLEYKLCEYKLNDGGTAVEYGSCRTNVSQVTDSELGRVVGATTDALGPVTPFAGIINGVIWWDAVTVNDDGNICSVDEYFENNDLTDVVSDAEKETVARELETLRRNIDSVIGIIESDPTVQFCMTGRQVDGIKPYSGTVQPRFPELTKQTRKQITTQALNKARENYWARYDKLLEQQTQDYIEITERMAEIRGENAKDARREAARYACVNLAEMSGVAKSKTPQGLAGIITAAVVLIAAAIVVTVFTAGAGTVLVGSAVAAVVSAPAGLAGTMTVMAPTITAAGINAAVAVGGAVGSAALVGGVAGAAAADYNTVSANKIEELVLSGHFENNQWNYRETIDTNFDYENLICHKCVKAQNCSKTRSPFFGDMYCESWSDTVETCNDIQF